MKKIKGEVQIIEYRLISLDIWKLSVPEGTRSSRHFINIEWWWHKEFLYSGKVLKAQSIRGDFYVKYLDRINKLGFWLKVPKDRTGRNSRQQQEQQKS